MSDDKTTPPGVEAMVSPGNLLFSGRGPTHFTLPLREGDVVTVGDLRGITLTLREVDIADHRAMAERIAELEAQLEATKHERQYQRCVVELRAKLAKVREAWERYQRHDLDREEFEGTVAEVVEGT
jgi:hypothetical protein